MVSNRKKRSNHRRRERMTVQAFCACPSPSDCIAKCAGDIQNLSTAAGDAGTILHLNAMFGG